MFEYLLVIASTIIYFRVFTRTPQKSDKCTQTEPWECTQILDLMDVSISPSPSSELCATVQFVDWFESAGTDSSLSSEIELPPLQRQKAVAGAQGLKIKGGKQSKDTVE